MICVSHVDILHVSPKYPHYKKHSMTEARCEFADMVASAHYGAERTTITRNGKLMAAVVPLEEPEAIGALEDLMDRIRELDDTERCSLNQQAMLVLDRAVEGQTDWSGTTFRQLQKRHGPPPLTGGDLGSLHSSEPRGLKTQK
mgnify:CR=1 FL=1